MPGAVPRASEVLLPYGVTTHAATVSDGSFQPILAGSGYGLLCKNVRGDESRSYKVPAAPRGKSFPGRGIRRYWTGKLQSDKVGGYKVAAGRSG